MADVPKKVLKIVRVAHIVGKNNNGNNITHGFIVYDRIVSDHYKVKENPETDPNLKRMTPVTESDFPIDEFDNLLIAAVRTQYKDSFFQSYTDMGGLGKSSYDYILNRKSHQGRIVISAERLLKIQDLDKKVDFPVYIKNVKIYINSFEDELKDLCLMLSCSKEQFERFNELDKQVAFL